MCFVRSPFEYHTLTRVRNSEILLRPDHKTYKAVNRFLLSRPQLDLSDVPMFYEFFNSGGPNYRQDRSWMLRVIHSGLASEMVNDVSSARSPFLRNSFCLANFAFRRTFGC